MSVSIRECRVDQEFRDAIPRAAWDERAELQASVARFGYLSPIIAWKNERGECLILDGHNRWESWRAACANPGASGLAASEPAVVVLDLPSREEALLFVINSQLGRRNIADIDRIMLVSKREEILRRKAKANPSAAGKQTSLGRKFCDVVLAFFAFAKSCDAKPSGLRVNSGEYFEERFLRNESAHTSHVAGFQSDQPIAASNALL